MAKGSGLADKKLKQLAERIDAAKAEVDTARGTVGNLYQELEQGGEHRMAFKTAMRLRGMEATQRAAYLRSLKRYISLFSLDTQADAFDAETGKDGAGLVTVEGGDGGQGGGTNGADGGGERMEDEGQGQGAAAADDLSDAERIALAEEGRTAAMNGKTEADNPHQGAKGAVWLAAFNQENANSGEEGGVTKLAGRRGRARGASETRIH